jgi:hypothetical protein
MSDKILTVDADTGPANRKVDETKKKVDGIGDAAGRVGDKFGTWGRQLGSIGMKMAGIMTAINGISSAFEARTALTTGANKTAGASTLARGEAAQSLGISENAATAAITGPAGSASVDEMDSFLASMASSSKGKMRPRQASVMAALSAKSSGLFTDQELLDRMQRGMPMPNAAEVQKRRGLASPEKRDELDLRARERSNSLRAQAENAPAGAISREAQSVMDRRRAESPWSWTIADAGLNIPIVGDLIKADRQFAAETEVRKNLEKIAETNKQMAMPRLVVPIDPANAPR